MINTKLTEEFLLAQEDVFDASVWFDGESLKAAVTPNPGAHLDLLDLEGVCVAEIGPEQTPRDFVLIAPHGRA